MTPRHPRLALLVLPPLAPLLVAGCSDTKAEPISDQVAAAVAQQLDLPAREIQASCPSGAEAKEAATFTCDLTVDGQEVQGAVTFSTDEAFSVELAADVLPKDVMEAEVKAELARRFQGIDVTTVDCGGEDVVVIAVGETVNCNAEDSAGAKATAVIGLDADGKAIVESVTDPNAALPG